MHGHSSRRTILQPAVPCAIAFLAAASLLPAAAQVVDISGLGIAPDSLIPAGQSGRFIADSTTKFDANWSRPLDINGFTVMSNTGGGNTRTFSSVISGTGIVASDNNFNG